MKDNVFGLAFSRFTINELGNNILLRKYANKVIATPNVDHVVRYHHDESFFGIYNQIDLLVNDSRILMLLSSLGLTESIKTLIPGSDLTEWLFKNSPPKTSICIIGSSIKTIEVVRLKFPQVNITHYNPPMGFINFKEEVDTCINFVLNSEVDLVFFAVGSPRQEDLAVKVSAAGSNSTFLCVGASILFLSGEETRAPKILQTLHLEWLFRLINDPKRLARRYLVDGPKIFKIFLSEVFKRKGPNDV